MQINAWAALAKNAPLTPFVYEKELTPEDVLIKVKYRTLSNSDVLFIGDFWGNTKYPLVPGEDIIGEIVKRGDRTKGLEIGDVVGVGYQVYCCGLCEWCKSGLEQFCRKQKNLRIHEHGGLADFMIVNHKFAFKIPKNLQRPEATPLFCGGLTVYSAIINNGVAKDMKVGVVGIGRLGHLALKFLKSMGCQTYAFTSNTDKKTDLAKKGYNVIDPKNDFTEYKESFDLLLYTSTADLDWNKYLSLLRPVGKMCLVGFPQNRVQFYAGLLNDYSRRQIVGNFIGSRKDMIDMISYASKHKILADAEIFPYQKSNEVLNFVRKGAIKYVSVVSS